MKTRRLALLAAGSVAALAPSADAAAQDDVAHIAGIGRPAAASPRNGPPVAAAPPFSWSAVRGAAKYEFQLSTDSAFRSIVDRGSFETRNTFATIEKTLADGNCYWRTRALDSRDRAGSWSATRAVFERWSGAADAAGRPGSAKLVVR